jgi:phosphoribosyl 1,2-cyclic phosphodiesterase
MKLTFIGTRGQIEERSSLHQRHSALLVEYRGKRVLVDCGEDWRGEWRALRPQAIVLTHAHPDHAFGLKDGADCPVYATEATWDDIGDYPLSQRCTLQPRQPVEIRGMRFEAFTVEHSTRCPSVGYRVTAGRPTIFYCPDVVDVHERAAALSGARLYIGDGATLDRSLIRRQDDHLVGHTTVRAQVGWCAEAGVPTMLVTHCGTQIVAGDEDEVRRRLEAWGSERGVDVALARDGLSRILR